MTCTRVPLGRIFNRATLKATPDDQNKPQDDDAGDEVSTFLARRRQALKASGTPTTARRWYTVQARAAMPDEVDVLITGEIGWDIDSGMFARALAQPEVVNASVLHVSLNSVGGDVFDGIGIYNALVGHGAQIIVTVTGIAASIASVIAMAGDIVIMGRGSQMMIHDAHALQIGNAADMTKMAEILDRASNNIATFYAERAGGTMESWRAIMQEERWYLAQEAVDAGLADEVTAAPERQAAAATAITLAAKVRHVAVTPAASLAARATDVGEDAHGGLGDLSTLVADLGAGLAAEFAPPADPMAGIDLLADIRAAVAFVATDMPEPVPTPVDDRLPSLTYDNDIADLRRLITREGM
jgi:ATP-dependent protease ClpP protease subunit